jgi:ABC-type amino acid transport system permease subunit
VSLIRDTSLLWFIGVMEFTQTILFTSNREVNTEVTMGLYIFAMVVYFLICYPLTALSDRMETRLGAGEKREFRRIIGLVSN